LVSITIGKGVTNIGEMGFYNCSKLKNVYYKGSEQEWSNITIKNHNDSLTNATRHYNS